MSITDAEYEEAWHLTRENAYELQRSSAGLCVSCGQRWKRNQIAKWIDREGHPLRIPSATSTAVCPGCRQETIVPGGTVLRMYHAPFAVGVFDYVRRMGYVEDR
jgi:hypothetical protein